MHMYILYVLHLCVTCASVCGARAAISMVGVGADDDVECGVNTFGYGAE